MKTLNLLKRQEASKKLLIITSFLGRYSKWLMVIRKHATQLPDTAPLDLYKGLLVRIIYNIVFIKIPLQSALYSIELHVLIPRIDR